MTSGTRAVIPLVALLALSFLLSACGGGAGRVAFVGIGNSGNKVVDEGALAEEIASVLVELDATPSVSDHAVAEVFDAMLAQARQGNAEAALIVLHVARMQREPREDAESD